MRFMVFLTSKIILNFGVRVLFVCVCVSLAGSAAVICGLYVVLWGKEKDEEEDGFKQPEDLNQTTQIDQEESCRIDLEQPLLISTSPHSKDHQEK